MVNMPDSSFPESSLPDSLCERILGVIREIRVPDLPYPVGQPDRFQNWSGLLREHWTLQTDQRVSEVLNAQDGPWSVQQVNGAYLADRIMDVFLRSSGLHPVLVARLARLRYPLAWWLVEEERPAFTGLLVLWLDSFEDWRGWSDSGGRSSRALLDQLDQLIKVIDGCFDENNPAAFAAFCERWQQEAERRHQHSSRLHQRLLDTETGAARQRRADQLARAVTGRALEGRQLPPATQVFLMEHWLPLLRQVAWREGVEGDNWRHGTRLLEWMVWAGDPVLSGQNMDRLYQVGEQLSDRITEVWQRVWQEPPPHGPLSAMEAVLVDRLRGGAPQAAPTADRLAGLDHDPSLIELPAVSADTLAQYRSSWFVEGSGTSEQRRFFLAFLEETAEVLWSNGYGVRLGLTPWQSFQQSMEQGRVRPLPALSRFGDVLEDTVSALDRVLSSQRQKRQEAARKARERAEQLRLEQEAEARQRAEQEAARRAEAERQAQQAREQAEQEEADRIEAARVAAREQALTEVDRLSLGGWIALKEQPDNDQERRLKLAVRINASRKLVFVDRLGLNRTELTVEALVERLLSGTARILGASAEFDETLSRVVGRIRVGR